jgi:hypothetical protein
MRVVEPEKKVSGKLLHVHLVGCAQLLCHADEAFQMETVGVIRRSMTSQEIREVLQHVKLEAALFHGVNFFKFVTEKCNFLLNPLDDFLCEPSIMGIENGVGEVDEALVQSSGLHDLCIRAEKSHLMHKELVEIVGFPLTTVYVHVMRVSI